MKKFLIGLIVGLLLGGGLMYWFVGNDSEQIEVPVYIEVPVPNIDNSFDPIEDPEPLVVHDSIPVANPININLKRQLDSAKTELDSLKALKAFAIKRIYKEEFKDDFQTITVNAETTGTLDKLSVDYKTEEYTIPLDTTVTTDVPRKGALYYGGSIMTPYGKSPLKPSVKASLDLLNKKNNKIYGLSVDPFNQTLDLGITFKW